MLAVKPLPDREKAGSICRRFGTDYSDEVFVYYAAEVDEGDLSSTDNLLGLCTFTLSNGLNEILFLDYAPGTHDTEAVIILSRAVMSFMNRCGVKTVKLSESISEEICSSLALRIEDNRSVDLDSFFESPCKNAEKSNLK